MGGGGDPFPIPDYKAYDNWQKSAKLVEHANRLQKLGLKDPWIRNYTWLYTNPNAWADVSETRRVGRTFKQIGMRGIWAGLAIAAGMIVIDEGYTLIRYGYTSWNKPAHH